MPTANKIVSINEVTTQQMTQTKGSSKRSIVFSKDANDKIEAAQRITGLPKSALVRLAVMNYDYSQLTNDWEKS